MSELELKQALDYNTIGQESEEEDSEYDVPQSLVEEHTEMWDVSTTTVFDPTSKRRYPIISKHTPQKIVDAIMNYSSNTDYVSVINCGVSGSGKTTWTQLLVHNLHERDPRFNIHWYKDYDIRNMGKIIRTLKKGVPHIIIFDDASFSFESMGQKELYDLMKELTTIRHTVQGKVILIMNQHYSKALKKFFRDTAFYFLTSINQEELNSYEDTFGKESKKILRQFAKKYRSMMLNKLCSFEISTDKEITYHTNKPFRLGLGLIMGHLEYFVYYQDSCGACSIDNKERFNADCQKIHESLAAKYGEYQATRGEKYFLFMKGVKGIVDNQVQAMVNGLIEVDSKEHINLTEMGELVRKGTKQRPRIYTKRKEMKEALSKVGKDVINILSTEENNNSFILPEAIPEVGSI